MKTREFFPAELPGVAPTQPAAEPGLPPAAKSERAFAAVIDQKLRAKNPPPSRETTRSSAKAASGRGQAAGGLRKFAKAAPKTLGSASNSSTPSNPSAERANASPASRASLSANASEDELPDATPTRPAEDSSNDQAALPTNVIPFPFSAVIIPFPQLIRADGASVASTSSSARETEDPTTARAEGTITPLPLPLSPGGEAGANAASAADELDDVEIDVPWPSARARSGSATETNIEVVDFQTGSPGEESSVAVGSETPVPSMTRGLDAQDASGLGVGQLTPTHLPSAVAQGENSAGAPPRPLGGFGEMGGTTPIPAGNVAGEPGGIAAAPPAFDMHSKRNSEPHRAFLERHQQALEELDGISVRVSEDETQTHLRSSDSTARSLGAMEWQAGRPVGFPDRPTPLSLVTPGRSSETSETSATVERLSQLVLRETSLLRQHGSDAMSVVLRPDAQTELFVHFSQRNGQLQAAVRCERGDFHQLNTLWTQLQESLAQQKVSLAPLQETSSSDLGNGGGSQSSGLGGSGPGQGQEPGRQARGEEPALPGKGRGVEPAPDAGASRNGRQTRPADASGRPSWETWA